MDLLQMKKVSHTMEKAALKDQMLHLEEFLTMLLKLITKASDQWVEYIGRANRIREETIRKKESLKQKNI